MSRPTLSGGGDELEQVSSSQLKDLLETRRRIDKIHAEAGKLRIADTLYYASFHYLIFVRQIGHGSSGEISEMTMHGKRMAVKQIHMAPLDADRTGKQRTELLELLKKTFGGPNIVHLYGYFCTDRLLICSELMVVNLDRLVEKVGPLPFPEAIFAQIALSVLKALCYLADAHGISHSAVRPSNILLNAEGIVKLKLQTFPQDCNYRSLPRQYLAPEQISSDSTCNPYRADVWSLGLTLLEVARGRYPYADCETTFEIFTRILETEPPIPTAEEGFSQELVDLLTQMLKKNAEERPTSSDLLERAFLRDAATQESVAEWLSCHWSSECSESQEVK